MQLLRYINGLSFCIFRFTPEQLGMTASSALVWLFVELMVIIMTLYVFGMSADVRYLDLLALCGYKYVG